MKSQGLGHRILRYKHAYAFIAPFFVIFAVFGLYPTAYSLVLSFHEWSANQPWTFIALLNYGKLLGDPVFWTSVWNVIYIYLVNVPAMVILSVIIAVVLNSPYQRFKDFFRVTYLIPYVTSVLSITIVFFVVFDDSRGLVNLLLSRVGLTPVHWLTSKKIAKLSIDILVTWKWLGYNMIIALAGLQSIDTQVYDACRIDGAGTLRTFFRISLPLIRPVVGFQLIMATIGTLTMFTEPYILTDGGPGYASLTPVLYLYRSAFKFMKLGYGAAIAFLTFILVLVPSAIQVRLYAERGRSYTAT